MRLDRARGLHVRTIIFCACIIGASVSESHLGSSKRPLSVCLSIYIYIYPTSVIFGPAAPALRVNVSRLI